MFLGDVRRHRGGVRRLLELLLALHPQQLHARVRLLHLVHLGEKGRAKVGPVMDNREAMLVEYMYSTNIATLYMLYWLVGPFHHQNLMSTKGFPRAVQRQTANQWCTVAVQHLGSTPLVQCMFCFETCSPEGRGGGKGGNANFKTKHTDPLTSEIISPL